MIKKGGVRGVASQTENESDMQNGIEAKVTNEPRGNIKINRNFLNCKNLLVVSLSYWPIIYK